MSRSFAHWLAGAVALAAPWLAPSEARAETGPAACGNIHVEAEATCKVEVEGGCTAKCEPVSFQAACAGQLKVECDGTCTASASAECTGSCDPPSCQAECEGGISCTAQCEAKCEGNCAGKCSTAGNKGECEASCKATCGGECSASCEVDPPSCEAQCEAVCQGSCEAEANLDCQISCQNDSFLECTGKLEGGCTAACESPDGAVFCDGQYVDHGNNLDDCLDWLSSVVTVEASAEGSCDGNSCEGEAKASASCATATGPVDSNYGALAIGALGAAVFAARRRRRVS
jgi:MYXO-CTERM domain-containing protein